MSTKAFREIPETSTIGFRVRATGEAANNRFKIFPKRYSMADGVNVTDDFLIYDGDCPVCSQYVAWTALRAAHPGIQLIDARTTPELVSALRAEGIEINDTYLLQLNGERYVAAAAMARISALMEPQSPIQRLLKSLTRSERAMTPVYPLLSRGRKALLWLLGREQIR